MKISPTLFSSAAVLLSIGLFTTPVVHAQTSAPPAAPASSNVAPSSLDELLAPIALYPDALVALILPAATASSDIVLAARYLNGGGDPTQVDSQPWDDSVKALAHYPDVIKWMDENLAWTERLGEAYLDNSDDVMAAIQHGREKARANGVLVDTPQQQVVTEDDAIRIVPAQPDVIYVPRYDPEIIYVDQPVYSPEPWLTFGVGFGVGAWLAYDCDWHSHVIVVDHDRRGHWDNHFDWRRRELPGHDAIVRHSGWTRWTAPEGRHPQFGHVSGGRAAFHPAPIAGTSHLAPGAHGHVVTAGQIHGSSRERSENVRSTPFDASRHASNAMHPTSPVATGPRPEQNGFHPAATQIDRHGVHGRTPALTTSTPNQPAPTRVWNRSTNQVTPSASSGPAVSHVHSQNRTVNHPSSSPTRAMDSVSTQNRVISRPATPAVTRPPMVHSAPAVRAYVPTAPRSVTPSAPAAVRAPAVQNRTFQPAVRVEHSNNGAAAHSEGRGNRDGRDGQKQNER